jgi:hypothetical protein
MCDVVRACVLFFTCCCALAFLCGCEVRMSLPIIEVDDDYLLCSNKSLQAELLAKR